MRGESTMVMIAVVGGVVMDLVFEVPEWPKLGEAIQGTLLTQPGGKGLNQAVACTRLGGDVSILTAVGDDGYGQRLLDILDSESVKPFAKRVHRTEDISTDMTAVILLKDGQPGFIGCRRATNDLTIDDIRRNAHVLAESDLILVTCDVSPEVVQCSIDLAKAAHRQIILNAAPPPNLPLRIISQVDYVIANGWEARKWLSTSGVRDAFQLSDRKVGETFLGRGAGTVIITNGIGGCSILTRGKAQEYRSFQAHVVDETGASDAFCAALGIALGESQSRDDYVRFASAAGALACEHLGAYNSMPSRDDVLRFLQEHHAFSLR